ncbi:hypothetical protein EC991_000922 [Linnemannia zychae]|nr:hypothetical protein EC991_000922 [Linnemannia zychae]
MSPFSQLAFWKSFFQRNFFSHDQIPDLTGKVAIVTGANSGLGYATTVALAAHGARVFLACRSEERATEAIEKAKAEIKAKFPYTPAPQLDFLELDQGDLNKTRHSAEEFLKLGLPLHILINNAGIYSGSLGLTVDGIERDFGVNYLGAFVFTLALLDRIKESQPSRIVIVSSYLHERAAGINYDTIFKSGDTEQPHHLNLLDRYGRSKLAISMFTIALARRVKDQHRLFVNHCHPGYIPPEEIRPPARDIDGSGQDEARSSTLVSKVMDGWKDWFSRQLGISVEKGVLTQLYLATSPEIENKRISGRYFWPVALELQPSSYALDEKLQEELWAYSEKFVNGKLMPNAD